MASRDLSNSAARNMLSISLVALVTILATRAAAAAAGTPVDPAVVAAVAPVRAAIDRAKAQQASLPHAQSDLELLRRLATLDQAPRKALSDIDFSALNDSQKQAVWAHIAALEAPIDKANETALLGILPPEGWFTISRYGREASTDAFLIVQHGNPELWRRFLPILGKLALQREVDGGAYALMFDRLQWSQGLPQRYGSQMICRSGKYIPADIEDPVHIDERRRTLGMSPYAEYLKKFEADTC